MRGDFGIIVLRSCDDQKKRHFKAVLLVEAISTVNDAKTGKKVISEIGVA